MIPLCIFAQGAVDDEDLDFIPAPSYLSLDLNYIILIVSAGMLFVFFLVCLFKDGTKGENKYGPSPKYQQ